MTMGNFYALMGAAIAVLVSCVGSAIGVSRSGQAASALLAKQPEKFGNCLLLTVMPSTQGLYGFVVGFMILIKLNVFGGMTPISDQAGWVFFAYSLPIAIVGLASAILQGNVVISGINLIGKQDGMFGKAMPLVILVEMFAIFAFIISFLGVMMTDVVAVPLG